jgi:hypothetical protein
VKPPAYDPKRDGPVFPWILRAAVQVREARREQREREYVKIVERRLQWLPKRQED